MKKTPVAPSRVRIARGLVASSRDSMSSRWTWRHVEGAERGLVLLPEGVRLLAGHRTHDDLSAVAEPVGDGPQDVLVARTILVTPDRHDGARAPGPGAGAPRRVLAKHLDLPTCVHVSRPGEGGSRSGIHTNDVPCYAYAPCVALARRPRDRHLLRGTARPLLIPACLHFP